MVLCEFGFFVFIFSLSVLEVSVPSGVSLEDLGNIIKLPPI